jgi:hypothetical protein
MWLAWLCGSQSYLLLSFLFPFFKVSSSLVRRILWKGNPILSGIPHSISW